MNRTLAQLAAYVTLLAVQLPLCAQTLQDCPQRSPSISVRWNHVSDGQLVSEQSQLGVDVRVFDPNQQLSRVRILAGRNALVDIGASELLTLERGGVFSIPVSVVFGPGDSSHLPLATEKSYTLIAMAYGNQGVAPMACNYDVVGIHTGKRASFAVLAGFDYKDLNGYQLEYAQKDAEDVAKHLLNNLNINPENTWLFSDDPAAPAMFPGVHVINPINPKDVTNVIVNLAPQIDANSTLYVYFSGHQFVPPTDASGYADTRYIVLPNSQIGDESTMISRTALDKFLAGHKEATVIIFDACFSGNSNQAYSNASTGVSGAKNFGSLSRSLPPYEQPSLYNGARLNSSKGSKVSYEVGDDVQHGLFTYFLLQATKLRPYPGANSVTLDEAYKFAKHGMHDCAVNDLSHCLITTLRNPYDQDPDGLFTGEALDIPWANAPTVAR